VSLGVGRIFKGKDTIVLRVQSLKDLIVVIYHFDKYPLITQKRADYELLKSVVEIMNRKEHLTTEGINKIVAIKSSINKGLSEELKVAFPDVVYIQRPLVVDQEIKDPNWLAGFVSGEGCLYISISKSSFNKSGFQVQLYLIITQHLRDQALINSLIEYLGCGRYKVRSGSNYYGRENKACDYLVTKFVDHIEKIIPFFDQYPILSSGGPEGTGVKGLD
jgi:hypothetical protein